MDLPLSERQILRLCVGVAVVVSAAVAARLLARGARRAGLTAAEAAAVAAWQAGIDRRLGLPTVLVGVAAFAGLLFAFRAAEIARNDHLRPHLRLSAPVWDTPSYYPWAVPAALLALPAAGLGRRVLVRLALGRDGARAYRKATAVTDGFDARRVAAVATALYVPLVLVGVVFALDWYCKVGPDHVAVSRFWSLGERRYELADVRAELADHRSLWDGSIRTGGAVVLHFPDGDRWEVAGHPAENRDLIAHLTRQGSRRK